MTTDPIATFLAARRAYVAAVTADAAATAAYRAARPADPGPRADEATWDAYDDADNAAWLAAGCSRTMGARMDACDAMLAAMPAALGASVGVPSDAMRDVAAVIDGVLSGRSPTARSRVVGLALSWQPSRVAA